MLNSCIKKYIALHYSKPSVAASCCFDYNEMKFETPDSPMSNFENILEMDQGNHFQWPSLVDTQ